MADDGEAMKAPSSSEATLSPGYSSATREDAPPPWKPYEHYISHGWIAGDLSLPKVFLWLDGEKVFLWLDGECVEDDDTQGVQGHRVTRPMTDEEEAAARLGGFKAAYAVFLETERSRNG